MRLVHRRQKNSELELNMPAMVDIVFLLLIFFMCTSTMTTPEQKLAGRMTRPSSGTQATSDDARPIRIQVKADGVNAVVLLNDRPCRDYESLIDKLKQLRQLADSQVIIEGQNSVLFQHMVNVLDACAQANFTRVAFSPRE